MSVGNFLDLLQQKTGVPPAAAEILAGFPPKPLQLPADQSSSLSVLGLQTGDTFTLRAAAAAPPAATPAAATPGPAAAPTTLSDADADLARAIAASLSAVVPPQPPPPQPASSQGPAAAPGTSISVSNGPPGAAPTSVPLDDGSCVVRRIIDSDNSCLFNAVGYIMEHTRARSKDLRAVIAKAVASDPVTYNDGFLGMDNQEYCKWIQNPDKWGGAIELFILSAHYGREIAAFDIRTKRCDVYGQDAGYSERSMVIYDGLHYDALAVSAFEGAPEELDITIFNPHSAEGQAIAAGAAQLVEKANAARQFTDTTNFKLRCGVCQIGIKGEKEAVEHAKATGHSNFSEY